MLSYEKNVSIIYNELQKKSLATNFKKCCLVPSAQSNTHAFDVPKTIQSCNLSKL